MQFEVFARIAQHVKEGVAHLDQGAVGVVLDDADDVGFDGGPELRFADQARLFGQRLVGEVEVRADQASCGMASAILRNLASLSLTAGSTCLRAVIFRYNTARQSPKGKGRAWMKNGTDAAPARHPGLKSSYKKCLATLAGERARLAGSPDSCLRKRG